MQYYIQIFEKHYQKIGKKQIILDISSFSINGYVVVGGT